MHFLNHLIETSFSVSAFLPYVTRNRIQQYLFDRESETVTSTLRDVPSPWIDIDLSEGNSTGYLSSLTIVKSVWCSSAHLS